MTDADQVLAWCDELGAISDEPDRLTRPFASDSMRRVNALVGGWMTGAGLAVRRDQIGNLIGRYESDLPGGRTLLIGSHLDSVRGAGKYDGPLGVVVGLAAVKRLHDAGRRLPYAIELVGFADEEGLRFGATYLGSQALAGAFDLSDLDRRDAEGVTMADAVRAFGGDPGVIAGDRWSGGELLGYAEVHIEQGPVLEAHGLAVGVVTAIAGQARYSVELTGEAGHAGTVPMDLRRDALCAAAELVLAVEAVARDTAGLVATVGEVSVQPGAANVVPGSVALSLDVRHQDDAVRSAAAGRILERAAAIGATRRVEVRARLRRETAATPCDPGLSELFAAAIAELGLPVERLASGAGHDAVPMARIAPVGMLFVRCRGGISHNPAESVETEDVAVALNALGRFLELLGQGSGHP